MTQIEPLPPFLEMGGERASISPPQKAVPPHLGGGRKNTIS